MSDQDFFFDEDEQPKKDAPKGSAKQGGNSSGSKASSAPSAAAAAPAQNVSMTVTVLAAVVALLLGIIVGIFVGRSTAAPVPGITGTPTNTGAVQAPQLSPEQLQGGELPPNHPDIGGGAPGGSTAESGTPSEETTK